MCRIVDSLRANESGSSIPFGRQPHPLTRKRAQRQPRHTVTRKGRRSKRNPSPASERIIESAALPLTCALARWGFRFAGLHSRVNAWQFRIVSLLRVSASFFWQNGMEMRLSLITASSTSHTPSMCRFIDNPRAIDVPHHRQPAHNDSGSSIPFGRQPHPVTRKRAQQQPRRTVTRKGMRSKRNPSPASVRSIVSSALPLTCALARWGSVLQAFSRESMLARFGSSRSCELTHRFFGKTEWRCVCR